MNWALINEAHSITDAPVFASDAPAMVDVQEGESTIINMTVRANPNDVTYTWYKNGDKIKFDKSRRARREVTIPRFNVDGGVLYVVNVTRDDAGAYSCKAKNPQGKLEHSFSINVLCKKTFHIIQSSENVQGMMKRF